ncbi:MAG: hypothetical protein GY940_19735 [bacterium]|nr:hypothetical protein [bacterium]
MDYQKWITSRLKRSIKPVMMAVLMAVTIWLTGFPGLQAAQEEPAAAVQEGIPAELEEMETRIKEVAAQVTTLDKYAPEKYPDFKELQKANQLVEQKNFNDRKFKLLIKQFNIFDDELFPFLLTYSAEHPGQEKQLAQRIEVYIKELKLKEGEPVPGQVALNYYELQKQINRVSLRIERFKHLSGVFTRVGRRESCCHRGRQR